VQIVCLYSSGKILFKICYAAVCILIIAPLITILYVKYGSINAFFCPQTMGNIALSIKHENNEIINVISGIMNISCGNIFPINVLRNYGVIALLAFGALFLYILHSVYPRNKNIINRTTMQMVQRLKETISMRMAFFIIAGFLFIMQYNIFDVKFIFTIFAVSSLFSLINNNTNAR
jgi:hypothetical protein